MSRIEFPLAQGWAQGLHIVFEDAANSATLELDNFLHVEQVHGAEIYQVAPNDLSRSGALARADGLYVQGDWFKTAKKSLLIKTADCVPLFYIDRQNHALCALHAGWRGLQKGIHRVPFERKYFDPKFTWVWMGPCLNGFNFEVGADMWSQFSSAQQKNEQFFATHPSDPTKRFFNSWAFVEQELKNLGVDLVYNVEVDTFDDLNFASYRRAGKQGQALNGARNFSHIGFR